MFWNKKRKSVELPPVLQPEDPVNYNSVLDYLVGLSRYDYDKILKVAVIYRDANKNASKILGINNEPSTTLQAEKPSDDEIDAALDSVLQDTSSDFEFLETDPQTKVEIDKTTKPSAKATK